jgi:hypothetical protein
MDHPAAGALETGRVGWDGFLLLPVDAGSLAATDDAMYQICDLCDACLAVHTFSTLGRTLPQPGQPARDTCTLLSRGFAVKSDALLALSPTGWVLVM